MGSGTKVNTLIEHDNTLEQANIHSILLCDHLFVVWTLINSLKLKYLGHRVWSILLDHLSCLK